MCDEYDDERMRVLWRQLAMREEASELHEEPESAAEPLVKPTNEVVLPEIRKVRTLTR